MLYISRLKIKILFLAFLTTWSNMVFAQSNKVLVLWHADSTKTRIQLFTRPVIWFGKDVVDIKSPITTLQYPANSITKFTYENDETLSLKGIDGNPLYKQEGNSLYFDKRINASDISLYSYDGKRMPAKFVQTTSGMSLPLTEVPSGIYLLSVNGQTFKIIKR